MKLKVLGSLGGISQNSYTSSVLINDHIALDAGTGLHRLTEEQILQIKDVVLTHSHIDHIALLCFLIDSHAMNGNSTTVHCLAETADALMECIFNNKIWPNMSNIVVNGKSLLSFNILKPYERTRINDIELTALPVHHGLPTTGYCLHGRKENFVFCFDMIDAPDEFWAYLKNLDHFSRMAIEISFANHLEELAKASYHLTPNLLHKLLAKIPESVSIYYNHTKSNQEIIQQQAEELMGNRVQPLLQDDEIILE
ncbi:MAG: 3',5'-cyclic-nucleotide phosphodiesterase [Proteobacteria bacterium]|nr:3',5'-cyclic-nucleotide phosphodiesterase [Pseudomonadota bacterium]MCH9758710.1 3',5'-cyclic-nucleotide phosphodiesterase [Pseudomonadota bacterium]